VTDFSAIDYKNPKNPFEELIHYGILRESGRYPWGSGENPHQRNKGFLDYVSKLEKDGLTPVEIAKGLDISTTQLRAAKSVAKNQQKAAQLTQIKEMRDKGMSNIAIGARLGLPESQVRALLKPTAQAKTARLQNTVDMLKSQVDKHDYLDIGTGVEHYVGISRGQLLNAVAQMEEEGYKRQYVKVKQLGTGKDTTVMVLVKEDVPYSEIYRNSEKIGTIAVYSGDKGKTFNELQKPRNISSDRIEVRYGPDGGAAMDGVIQVRRGVEDLQMGNAKYAQVRIAVDGTHYLKGMAMYADDLPDGVDIRFNTNKEDKGDKLKAMKPQKSDDETNPFGTVIRQLPYTDSKGNTQISAMNIVNSEGVWGEWSKSISTQMLSKQPKALAEQQLAISLEAKQREFDEVMQLTNPSVKKRLLQGLADDLDSSAVHLKAAALPRQSTQVILPINSLKDNEVFAPNYRDGEKVVLVRYPHGGIFEIPELTVNNRNREARSVIHQAKDAIGINSNVASRLSGADFDGDTVLVIPNNNGAIKTKPALEGLKNFDPQERYPYYDGMKVMSARTKQIQMGAVSNLITDMTIRKANDTELAAAVRHSMVVIDAEKHKLNWTQSAKDNGISALRKKYQERADKDSPGASTLISRATSPMDVENRRAARVSEGGPIDPETGKLNWVPTGESYVVPAHTRVTTTGKTVHIPEKTVVKTFKAAQLAETSDARTLSSGQPIEEVYATYSNRLKSMANEARKEMLTIKPTPMSPTAKRTYAAEVDKFNADLRLAARNAPLERKAQLVANAIVKAKQDSNPDMDGDQLKKVRNLAQREARYRLGAQKVDIPISDRQWSAIQAGAVSPNILNQILERTDLDRVKELATPRVKQGMTPGMVARARSMMANGYTQSEIAAQLGISTSTLNAAL